MHRYRDALSILINQGQSRGFITYQDVSAYLPDVGGSPQMVDDLVLALEHNGLDLVDDSDQSRHVPATRPAGKTRAGALPEEDLQDAEASSSPLFFHDRVRMYLKQMGDFPLLSRDREIFLAKKIEVSRKRYTLEETGRIFKVTRERIRQIEAKALLKLQHHTRSNHLRGFVENLEPVAASVGGSDEKK